MEGSVQDGVNWMNFTDYVSKSCQLTHESDSFTDVTFIAQNKKIFAHKIVLSASSRFFQLLLSEVPCGVNPVIMLNNIDYADLEAVVKFMYSGEVGIQSERFTSVLEVAQCLQIKGLTEVKALLESIEKNDEPSVETNTTLVADEGQNEVPAENILLDDSKLTRLLSLNEEQEEQNFVVEQQLPCLTFELLQDSQDMLTTEPILSETNSESKNEVITSSKKVVKRTRRKVVPGSKMMKSSTYLYNETALKSALEDMKNGIKLSEAASSHNIPKSTLYLHARAKGALVAVGRAQHTQQDIQDAIQAVVDGLSLKQAGEKFKIPKTVLWRKLRKKLDDGVLPNILSPRRRLQDPNLKEKASLALQKGHSISNVAKKYNIPVATVFRQKKFLVQQGRLDPDAIRKSQKHIVRKAVNAVLSGDTLNQAAATFNVSKTTVWRHLREMEKQLLESEQQPCYIVVEDEESSLTNTEQTNILPVK